MNYILCNIGNIPEHLKISINCILSIDSNAKVYLISDKNIKNPLITSVNFNDFEDLQDLKKEFFQYYKDSGFSSEKYPVFYTSLLRVFMLQKVSVVQNLKSFVHFDNDVSIYMPYEKIKDQFSNSQINITQVSSKDLVFGYSFFPNQDLISQLTKKLKRLISEEFYSNHYYRGGPLNEMRSLGIINKLEEGFFNILPSLPYLSKNDILFDPSSFGQYLNGMHHRRGNYIFRRRQVNPNEIIGSEITSKRLKPVFKDNKPKVIENKKSFEIANLHIHSKNLKRFLPANYKEHVNF